MFTVEALGQEIAELAAHLDAAKLDYDWAVGALVAAGGCR